MEQPVSADRRIIAIDTLRGFALGGVLLVNLLYFGVPFATAEESLAAWTAPWDRAALALIRTLAEGKFISLFAFLFGLGFALQLGQNRAPDPARRLRRRLWGLLAIGLIHAVLIWPGDVLILYALLGFLLLRFRTTPPRRLLLWAAGSLLACLALVAGYIAAVRLSSDPGLQFSATETNLTGMGAFVSRVYLEGSYLQVTGIRLLEYLLNLVGAVMSGAVLQVLALFLLGLWAGQAGLLTSPERHLPLLRRIRNWGLGLGLPAGLAFSLTPGPYAVPVPGWTSLLGSAGYLLGGPALGFGYAASILLATHRSESGGPATPLLAAAGRMALTNYLSQSLICTFLMYGYGLGWYGRVSPAGGGALAVAIFSLQLLWSRWWLSRFRFGPTEWLWRSLTYGRFQPLLITRRGDLP